MASPEAMEAFVITSSPAGKSGLRLALGEDLESIQGGDYAHAVWLEYFSEGSANVLFKIRSKETVGCIFEPGKHLLRLKKEVPGIVTTEECFKAYQNCFLPMLGGDVVLSHRLVRLQPRFVHRLNDILSHTSSPAHISAKKGLRAFLSISENHGMLIPNIVPQGFRALLDFKPKWLNQSLDAPPGSVRCRTCALRARREALEPHRVKANFCPLAIAADSETVIMEAVTRLFNANLVKPTSSNASGRDHWGDMEESDAEEQIRDSFRRGNRMNQLILKLQDLQRDLAKDGTLELTDSKDGRGQKLEGLLKAMTLRDCSLFVVVHQDYSMKIAAGDLDIKPPEKLEKWRKLEISLIEEGWYTGTEEHPKPEEICIMNKYPVGDRQRRQG